MSRMVLLSTLEETLKAIRAGKLALMVPVMMLTEGRWVREVLFKTEYELDQFLKSI